MSTQLDERPRRVVVTGGQTGGHAYPAASLALALTARGHKVHYVGARGHLEENVAARYEIPFTGFRFRAGPVTARWVSLGRATMDMCADLQRMRPDVVFSKGSLTGSPVVVAARILDLPIVLHESDTVPGREMRWLAHLTPYICIGHENARAYFREPVLLTGNLPRPNFFGGSRAACLHRYGIPADRPLVFVVGGSQGAQTLNEVVYRAVPQLTEFCSVVHACGAGKVGLLRPIPGYIPVESLGDEIRDVYAASDLVVSRAGATAIEEAAIYSVPALYVPYPWAERDHQSQNARVVASAGVAEVLAHDQLNTVGLLRLVKRMLSDVAHYKAAYRVLARSDAESLQCAAVLEAAQGKRARCA